jgi:hypothetical protein
LAIVWGSALGEAQQPLIRQVENQSALPCFKPSCRETRIAAKRQKAELTDAQGADIDSATYSVAHRPAQRPSR